MDKNSLTVVYNAMIQLAGQSLCGITRDGLTVTFKFGNHLDLPGLLLVIDCGFRFTLNDNVILSSMDIFLTSHDNENVDIDTFEFYEAGNSLFDEKSNHFIENNKTTLKISSISISKWGDLKLEFEEGVWFNTFTDISTDEECWRFITTESNSNQIIITGQGLSTDSTAPPEQQN